MTKRTIIFAILATFAVTARVSQAQVFFDRDDMAVIHGWVEGSPAERDLTGQQTYKHAGWRQKMLQQFPRADQSGDGSLTETEAIRYHMTQARMFTPHGKELDFLPDGTTRWTARVPMRDGETLPTEIYLPSGDGPWPVVFVRTSRGRIDSALDFGNELLRSGYAFVGQDLIPQGDFVNADVLGRPVGQQPLNREQRAAFNARRSRRNTGEDGHDAIEWIAQQAWCNGKIAMTGYSEACSSTKAAMAQLPPNLRLP